MDSQSVGQGTRLAIEKLIREATATHGDAELPDRIAHYRVLGRLGCGGMGQVYLAEDERLDRKVALKIIRPDRLATPSVLERFQREARAASRLNHPCICHVYEAGDSLSGPFLAMQLVPGPTLAELLGQARTADESAAANRGDKASTSGSGSRERERITAMAEIVEKVARALHAAHEAGLVHRDVKPGNIVVTPEGEPVLLDFGVVQEETADGDALTELGQQPGTPHYMAPEQLGGRQRLDRRSDVYALGVTLFECVTLRRPFDGLTAHDLASAILHQDPPNACRINAHVPRDLRAIVETAMAKDSTRRYATALDFAEDLRRLRQHEPVRARRIGQLARLQRWARRNPYAALLVVVLCLASGLVGGLAWNALQARAQLGTSRRYSELLTAHVHLRGLPPEETLYQPWRTRLSALDAWLKKAEPLRQVADDVRAALQEVRARALPSTPEQQERDRQAHPLYRELMRSQAQATDFERRLSAWNPNTGDPAVHAAWSRELAAARANVERLGVVVDRARAFPFAEPMDSGLEAGLSRVLQEFDEILENRVLARIVEYRARSQIVWKESCEDNRDAWLRAGDFVAKSPRYRGLSLDPQPGLVPLGPDPDSGLYEFVDLESGTPGKETPARDPAGHVMMTEEAGLVLVLLPAGKFCMGTQKDDPELPNHDPWHHGHEGPMKEVELSAFFISKFEMTQGQWERLNRGSNPSRFKAGKRIGDGKTWTDVTRMNPVEHMSWTDVATVLERCGLELPTEVEWEYACRAGTSTPWSCGDTPKSLQGHANLADRTSSGVENWWRHEPDIDDRHVLHAPVGSFAANAFGLHDMHGNLREWCRDWFKVRAYQNPVISHDGMRDLTAGTVRCVRGGSYMRNALFARSAHRDREAPDFRAQDLGLRPVRRIEE